MDKPKFIEIFEALFKIDEIQAVYRIGPYQIAILVANKETTFTFDTFGQRNVEWKKLRATLGRHLEILEL